MEHPSNREIASVLEQLAEHSQFVGARYPARAYQRAASAIAQLPVSVGALAMAGRATELRGIGRSIQSRIAEYCDTGTIAELERLREETPPARLLLTRLPGLGPKTSTVIWDTLRPTSIEELEEMVSDGRLRTVRGVGPATEDIVRAGILELEHEPEQLAVQLLRSQAQRAVADIAGVLRGSVPGVLRILEAGQLRRGFELVDMLDIVVVAEDTVAATAALREQLDARGWLTSSEDAPIVDECLTFALDGLSGAGVRIHVTDTAHEAASYAYAVGPVDHARTVLERSGAAPAAAAPTSPVPPDAPRAAPDADLYRRARLAWIAPERRDAAGALEAASAAFAVNRDMPALVAAADLRGELHCHSNWSDGRATMEAMAHAAIARGSEYLAITDHSWSLRIVNGLAPADLAAQWRELERVRATMPDGFHLLQGTELEILPDGTLDFPDDVLERLDWIVASIHSRQRQPAEEITRRIERAMFNPYVDCIGHPTSRLLLRRPRTELDTDRLIELAAHTGTFLEINSSPDRLDLDAPTAARAADAGVLLCINSDAHGPNTLGLVEHGAAIARRAGLRPDQVANTRSWEQLRSLQKRWRA
ncbi:MAG: polymerase [Thermoleophilia bacterium]|nr:polymerase [Thermoleophilia bacterium]MCZ4496859.1 polymerase [Thermoleophilia bacterium]